MAAMAGAWSLRRDLLQRGYDGIVALGPRGEEAHCAVVDLNRAGERQHVDTPRASGGTVAAISRLPTAAFAGRH